MLSLLSPEIILAIGAIILGILGFLTGRRGERNKNRADQAEADKKAILKRKELNDELESADPDERRKRLDKWVREAK